MTNPHIVRGAVLSLIVVSLAACGNAPVAGPLPPAPDPTAGLAVGDLSGPASAPGNVAPPAPLDCVAVGVLPIRDQLAQLLMVAVDSSGSAQAKAAVEQGVGGIFVASGSDDLLSSGALAQLNTTTKLRVMVAVDEEGGRVQRIDELAGSIPSARQMVNSGMTTQDVHDLAYKRGQDLHRYGVTVDFAPDTDVSDQPDRTVIGDRSFSRDPVIVTKYARAFADGLREAGVMPVIKHFPGHGEASGDSHKGPVTTPSLDSLKKRDLIPFQRLITDDTAAVPGVMVGHLTVPGLTDPGVPASLSPRTIKLLRDGVDYGAKPFNGVIFTDDLAGMAAITDEYSLPQAVLDSLKAGADVALFTTASRTSEVLDNLRQAVTDNRLPADQVQNSVRRVLRAKNVPVCR